MRALAVVVVNYGPADLLTANLTQVSAGVPHSAVYVVDNWSSLENRRSVEALCARQEWEGLYPDDNLGFGHGCNLAAEAAIEAGAERVLFLNPDATISAESIMKLAEVVENEPDCLVGPIIRTPTGEKWSGGVDLDLQTGSMRSWAKRKRVPDDAVLPWLTGACLMISVELWRRIGGFDTDYFLYWEDVDLAAKIRAVGGKLCLVESATAVHDEGGSHSDGVRTGAKSAIYYYYNIRNRMIFATKHLSTGYRRRWSKTAIAEAYRILLRGGRRQFARPRQSVWPAFRGVRDGWLWQVRHRN